MFARSAVRVALLTLGGTALPGAATGSRPPRNPRPTPAARRRRRDRRGTRATPSAPGSIPAAARSTGDELLTWRNTSRTTATHAAVSPLLQRLAQQPAPPGCASGAASSHASRRRPRVATGAGSTSPASASSGAAARRPTCASRPGSSHRTMGMPTTGPCWRCRSTRAVAPGRNGQRADRLVGACAAHVRAHRRDR